MNNPFPYSDSNKRYYTYDYYLRTRFGGKVCKVPLDGGFTCPNLDGTKGRGGCTYCTCAIPPMRGLPLAEQYEAGLRPLLRKWRGRMETVRTIPYFQSFSNTYAPVQTLRKLCEEALALPGAVGLSIATRADCIDEENAAFLHELAEKTDLTVELGLQTVHEKTAQAINRCHTFGEFLRGYERLEGIKRCVHMIDGLPGEGEEEMLASARVLADLHPHQIKFHFLYIAKGTKMAEDYLRGKVEELTLPRFCSILVSQLELLPPDIVIGRVTGDAERDELIAPKWSLKKLVVLNEIDKEFVKRETYQGKLYNMHKI